MKVVSFIILYFVLAISCSFNSIDFFLRFNNLGTEYNNNNSSSENQIISQLPPTQGEQSSGLFTVDPNNDGEMFYWLFRSKNESAPLLIWLEGGPGIPSSFQVFYGMGPYRISPTLNVTLNENTWNDDFNLLFFDNPCGVGYSSVQNNAFVINENQVSVQLASAIDQFMELYPEFNSKHIYLAGESYGGKYVPSLAYFMITNGYLYSWKISGIIIGDGLVDTPVQMSTYADFAYYHGIASLKEKQILETFQSNFQNEYNHGNFEEASNIFWQTNYFIMYKNVINFYNVDCDIECGINNYMWNAYSRLLNESSIKIQLNVPVDYSFNSQAVYVSASLNADVCKSVSALFPDLLSTYKTLLYQGSLDVICNAAGNDLWLSQVQWSAMDSFQQLNKENWFYGVNCAGWVRQYSNLTQIVLPNAGHFVPMDQPERAKVMMHNWLNDIPFPTSVIN